jgi:hypothetical protein
MWEEVVMANFKVLFRHMPDGLMKTMRNLEEDTP